MYRGVGALFLSIFSLTAGTLYGLPLFHTWLSLKEKNFSVHQQVDNLENQLRATFYHQKFLQNNQEDRKALSACRLFDPPLLHELQKHILEQAKPWKIEFSKFTLQLAPFTKDPLIYATYEMRAEGTCLHDVNFYNWLAQLEKGWGEFKIQQLIMGRAYFEEELTPVDFQLTASFSFYK